MKSFLSCVAICCLALFAFAAAGAQTFEINGQSPSTQPAKPGRPVSSANAANSSNGIGWGSSIEVGRLARAAETALSHGNPVEAANYAQRAVQAAPQDVKLWFLLGYTSRLAGRNDASLKAFQRGLELQPGSVEGLSGMALTYAHMGRIDDAKRLLMQVIAANPKRQNDLLVAGELFLETGDIQRSIELLQRAENLGPNARGELLMASGYMKLKQPEKAKQMLEAANRRSPNNVDVIRAVANYYRVVHDYPNAIATLRRSPQMTPDVLADLAYSYELNGDKKEAAASYSRAANMQPKQLNLQLSAANAEVNAGDLVHAQGFMSRAQAIDPNHYRLHAIKAVIAKAENRVPDAIAEYKTALQNMPQDGVPEGVLYPIQLRLNLAELYHDSGDLNEARAQMQTAEQEMSHLQVEGTAQAEFLRVRAAIQTAGEDYQGAEADLKQAMTLDPDNDNITLQYANLLWRLKREGEARKLYAAVLQKDPKNRYALESLGSLYRESGDIETAASYYMKFAEAYPKDFVPYLELGDMYASIGKFKQADAAYNKAYERAPDNPVILANAANAALENHDVQLAGHWVNLAKGPMSDDPRLMRERERYLFHLGKFHESALLGEKVLKKMPLDRNASVYLDYDYYNLGRYDDTLALASRYEKLLPKEPNFPLLAGHVHKQSQLLSEAVDDYSRAIAKDPATFNAYVNRGYVLNDLQDPVAAQSDFRKALKIDPKNGVAHLGMAFADLQLRHGREALDQVDTAEKLIGESGATHLVRATAYRQERLLTKAEKEYLAALKYSPDDLKLHMALADTYYYQRRYSDSINSLQQALRLSPGDPLIYAEMAHASAELRRRDDTIKYINLAEKEGGDESGVLLATGDALLTLGDRDAAMQHFSAALNTPDANRVDARLAIARLMAQQGRWDDAKEQVSLAFAESRIGESSPVTADDYIEAANVMLQMHDFDLAQKLFQRAKSVGAADEVVAIGLANTYLAQGDANDAQTTLASLGSPKDFSDNFDYNMAMANIYRQRHDNPRALTAFAQANNLAGEDDEIASQALLDVAGEEGLPIRNNLGFSSDLSVHPIFVDPTIYMLDNSILGGNVPPRSILETRWTNSFRYRLNGLPAITGFFQERNARGSISLPAQDVIVNQDTYDSIFNGAVNLVFHLGSNTIALNTGLQFTIRRDRSAPIQVNQNLFRQFVYLSTSSFKNWISMNGSIYHETGPYTFMPNSSRDWGSSVEFTVGRPWGKTAFVTGFSNRDFLISPLPREFFTTSTYAGVQRRISSRTQVTVLGEYIRSWQVQDLNYAIAQAVRPAFQLEFHPARNWLAEANFSYARGEGIHQYDNVQSGFFISYVKPLRRMFDDGSGQVPVEYPLRFSIGLQQQNFMNFTGRGQASYEPVFRLSLF